MLHTCAEKHVFFVEGGPGKFFERSEDYCVGGNELYCSFCFFFLSSPPKQWGISSDLISTKPLPNFPNKKFPMSFSSDVVT